MEVKPLVLNSELRSQAVGLMLEVGLEIGAIDPFEEDMYAVLLQDLMCYCKERNGSFEDALKVARERFEKQEKGQCQ
jgi:hypothetical protein